MNHDKLVHSTVYYPRPQSAEVCFRYNNYCKVLFCNLPPVTQMEGSPECIIPTHVTLVGEPPVQYPPFMRTFKINLESTWATCTLRDAENLLVNLLPDTVSRDFVWSSRTYRAEGNSWCLEYVVSPLVAEAINDELVTKSENMSSMGILGVQVDGFGVVEPKVSKYSIEAAWIG